ncbi:hypothetical protein GGR54DRAFT_183616 [Hypoxylon sp. NC1633]|nr:hypothetical protein GGR54DRAFT_183616 [Hypoxylon sp. NC1633]
MCHYVEVTYRCAHSELLAGPNCEGVLAQLSRINDASAWTPEGQRELPFDWPETCQPSLRNTCLVHSGFFCGWECLNSHAWFGLGAEAGAGYGGGDGEGYGYGGESEGQGQDVVMSEPWNEDAVEAAMTEQLQMQMQGARPEGEAAASNQTGVIYIADAGRLEWDFDHSGAGGSSATATAGGGATDSSTVIPAESGVGVGAQGQAAGAQTAMATPAEPWGRVEAYAAMQQDFMGEPDAQYLGPRIGVGWRPEGGDGYISDWGCRDGDVSL